MLQCLRSRVELALDIAPRDHLAGFWATIFAVFAAVSGWVYTLNPGDPTFLLDALCFSIVSLAALFKPARRTQRSWRNIRLYGAAVLVTVSIVLCLRYLDVRPPQENWIDYAFAGMLAPYLVWQVADYFFWRPRRLAFRRG